MPSFLLLLAVVSVFVSADELISVRCQAACLHHLQLQFADNAEMRRQMKHHVVNVCKENVNCSACTEPCREAFTDIAACRAKFCQMDEQTRPACEASCDFLDAIYSEKPGNCPSGSISTVYECTASCHLDGDCGETAKCCPLGCSRKCLLPLPDSSLLLPIPSGIIVQERKRRRSAVVRWQMKGLTPSQMNSLSSLYVLQWRWGLHEDSMTDWQTILIRNKLYAILKHLLSPGRFYEFRVAAVSTDGSRGFSSPSSPFKLSKEARAPGAPHLTIASSRLSPSGLWSHTIQWAPPLSDLPVKNYQLSWSQSSAALADSFDDSLRRSVLLGQQSKRSSGDEEEEEVGGVDAFALGGFGGKSLKHSSLLPSHQTTFEIEGLAPDSVYVVELHASVDSSEGELCGEKGMIYLRTSSLHPPPLSPIDSSPSSTSPSSIDSASASLLVGRPYNEGGRILTSLSWADSILCSSSSNYILRISKDSCSTEEGEHVTVEERVLAECQTVLDRLIPSCTYSIGVSSQDDPSLRSLTSSFSTACSPLSAWCSVSSQSPPSSSPSPISCSVESSLVSCHWAPLTSSLSESTIGYRVLLSSSSLGMNSISILPPQSPSSTFQNLASSTVFNLEVQPISSRGLGRAMRTTFRTLAHSSSSSSSSSQQDLSLHSFSGETVELPLESSASFLPWTPLLLLLLAFLRSRI